MVNKSHAWIFNTEGEVRQLHEAWQRYVDYLNMKYEERQAHAKKLDAIVKEHRAQLEALSAQNFELYQKLHGAAHHEHR